MNRYLSRLAILALCLSQVPISSSQQVTQLRPDDPALYSTFFFFIEGFSQWLDTRGQAVPANKVKLMQSAARYLHVNVSELAKISSISTGATTALRRIDLNARDHIDTSTKNHLPSDAPTLRTYEAQRQAAIQTAVLQLKQALSREGWNGLYAHINGEHRASVQVKFLPVPVPPPGTAH